MWILGQGLDLGLQSALEPQIPIGICTSGFSRSADSRPELVLGLRTLFRVRTLDFDPSWGFKLAPSGTCLKEFQVENYCRSVHRCPLGLTDLNLEFMASVGLKCIWVLRFNLFPLFKGL